jgi:hypothetical protein
METLLGLFGSHAWLAVVAAATPLAVTGLLLRRRALAAGERMVLARRAHRSVGDVERGQVALVGRWRSLAPGRGLLTDDGHAVVVDLGHAPAPADDAEVMVYGCATHQTLDPRGSDYRSDARVWVIDVRGDAHFVTADPRLLDRGHKRSRAFAGAGTLLLLAGVMIAVTGCVIAYRAAELGYVAPMMNDG